MLKEISVEQVRIDAEKLFRSRSFCCSEAIVYSIRKNFDPDMPVGLVAAASGFRCGVGASGCLCGTIAGAVICLGYFFGRIEPADPKANKCVEFSDELQESFRQSHGILCCETLTRGMDKSKGEHMAQCEKFTGDMAVKTAEIITRELNLSVV